MENHIPKFTITYSNGKIRYMDSYRPFPGLIIFNSNNSGKLAVSLDELRPDNIQIINNEEGRDVSAEIYHELISSDPVELQRQADTKREERQKLRLDKMARNQREINYNDNLLSGKKHSSEIPLRPLQKGEKTEDPNYPGFGGRRRTTRRRKSKKRKSKKRRATK